jgi:hypothetical protein
LKEGGGEFDLGEEDSGAGEDAEAGDGELEGRRVELVELGAEDGETVFGDLAEEVEGDVHVLGRGEARVRQRDFAGERGERAGEAGRDGQAQEETHKSSM